MTFVVLCRLSPRRFVISLTSKRRGEWGEEQTDIIAKIGDVLDEGCRSYRVRRKKDRNGYDRLRMMFKRERTAQNQHCLFLYSGPRLL